MTDAERPDGSALSEGLGPLPEPRMWYDHATQRCRGMAPIGGGPHELLFDASDMRAYALAERERIKAAVTRCTVLAENCEGDGPEVDTARKALACTILAAIAGYEAPAPAGAQQGLFGA